MKVEPLFVSYVDEVGALVFDIGSYSIRAGYAGEDMPKVIFLQCCNTGVINVFRYIVKYM